MTPPKVTVYVTNRNYGRFVAQAIESVLAQTFRDFELLVFDDGSTDDSRAVLERYRGVPRVTVVLQENRGLNATCRRAVEMARGAYVVRLDADDTLDPRAIEILSGVLDANPDVALVYPDYYRISEGGEVLDRVRLNDAGHPQALLDVPAHGACTMVRRAALIEAGSYDPSRRCQDGYDLWLKITARHRVRNVNEPLFSYRQHSLSLSGNLAQILAERREIKRAAFRDRFGGRYPAVLALVPVRGRLPVPGMTPLTEVAGRPLLDWTLEAAAASEAIDRVAVSTDDAAVAAHARARGATVVDRPPALSGDAARIETVAAHALQTLAAGGYAPDYVALLYATSPLRRAEHVNEAVQTALLFGTPSVVSVCEDPRFHYRHHGTGMVPLYEKRLLRREKEALYEENGAVFVSARGVVTPERFLGSPLGHILMTREEGVVLQSEFDRRVIEAELARRPVPRAPAPRTAASAGVRA